MRVKFFVPFLLLSILLASSAVAADLGILRVAASDHRPFFFHVQGEPAGLETDIISQIAESMQLEPEFHICTAKECAAMLQDGRIDLLTGVVDQPGMAARMLIVRPAYAHLADTVLYRLREAAPVKKHQQLRGKKLGVRSDAVLPQEIAVDRLIPRITAPNAARLFKLALAGTVDIVALDEHEGDAILREMGLEERFTTCAYRFAGNEDVFFAFSLRSRQLSRAGEFEKHLNELIDSGQLQELQHRYLNRQE